MLPGLGLELGRDVISLGTVTDAELHEWYRSADALAFPSVQGGLGAGRARGHDRRPAGGRQRHRRAAGVPHRPGRRRSSPAGGDPDSLAAGMRAVVTDERLRADLVAGGRALVPRFSWARAAREHAAFYAGT